MVSRYGVSKEGAVGVAVGVGPMHCLLPHCGGPHHHHHLSAPHPQNPQPGHNHHVHPAHQPPPSPSPHLNHQLSHHQLTVNINHLSHQQQQQQQTQHQQAPPQYRVVTANASKYARIKMTEKEKMTMKIGEKGNFDREKYFFLSFGSRSRKVSFFT